MSATRDEFIAAWNLIAKQLNDNAHAKGFYEEPRTIGDESILLVTEIAEYIEGFRHGNPPSEHIPAFTAMEEEKADCIIRIMETSCEHGERVAEAVFAKMDFNLTRPHKHGGKVL